MKKIISISFLFLVILICLFLCEPKPKAVDATTSPTVKSINQIEYTVVEQKFRDEQINEYTFIELNKLIEQQKNKQVQAHEFAELARALGWAETADPIVSAKAIWHNAQTAINAYEKRYEEKLMQQKLEYPDAFYIWHFMRDLGWSDVVCAGIMGNIMTEVGGNTLSLNPKAFTGNYYGICQWNKIYADQVWYTDLAHQCLVLNDTINKELDSFGNLYNPTFTSTDFFQLTNYQEVALAFAICYERCSSSTYILRQDNAKVAYEYFVLS